MEDKMERLKEFFDILLGRNVDAIVSDFHKKAEKLDVHASRQVQRANQKVEQAAQISEEADRKVRELATQVDIHHAEANRALAVKTNIKQLLAI
jgi:ABC-type uncharacterized transport system involved in gliding motility auxiliary subunit